MSVSRFGPLLIEPGEHLYRPACPMLTQALAAEADAYAITLPLFAPAHIAVRNGIHDTVLAERGQSSAAVRAAERR